MMKLALRLGAFAGTAGTGYAMSDEGRRNRTLRVLKFWSYTLPIFTRYRWEEFRVKNKSEEEQLEAFKALHRVYSQVCLDRILKLRGLYIKLGQIMTTRSDYAPPEYMEAFNILQDAVPARPFSEIRALVESELGRKVRVCFVDSLSSCFLPLVSCVGD